MAVASVRAGHEFYNNDYTTTEQAFNEFETLVQRLQSTLDAKEMEIDEVVLNSIAIVENWNAQELTDVQRWILSCSLRTETSFPTGLYEIFSNNMVMAAILRAHAGSLQTENGQNGGAPSSDKFRSLSEGTLGSSLASESFQSHIEKYFLGFPPEPLRSFHLKGIVC